MSKYNEEDFMPKYSGDTKEIVEEKLPEQPAMEEDRPASMTQARETDPVREEHVPAWAKIVSTAFIPVLIPTYAMILAMWLTPLAQISENIRFGATLVVLLITALPTMSCLLTLYRLGRFRTNEMATGLSHGTPFVVFTLCQLLAAYYLYKVNAPEWLFMFMVAGASVTVVCYVLNRLVHISGHAAGMGVLTAMIYYLGRNNLIEGNPTFWVMGLVLLSGLVGSAITAYRQSNGRSLALGYFIGALGTYLMLNIHIVNHIHNIYDIPS